ncbi:MAG: glycosyltransferase family 2 protein [Paludibacteraceae bacterium]
MDVSVIIVNYNTKELLNNCLESIYAHTKDVNYEIIVVDNASIDGSQEMIKARFSKVRLIESGVNLGFGRANNLGVKYTKGKYLFLLNSDTELRNNAIALFFVYMENHQNENIGAVGSYLLSKNEEIIHSYGTFPHLMPDLTDRIKNLIINIIGREKYLNSKIKKRLDKNKKNDLFVKDVLEVDYITGADLFLKKEIFNQFGGFDERYFMYYEETDLQFQMNRAGYKMLVISTPNICHLEKGSFQKNINQQLLLDKSSFVYYKKNKTPISFFLYKSLFIVINLLFFFDKKISFQDCIHYFKRLVN